MATYKPSTASYKSFFDGNFKDITSYESIKMELHLDSIGNVPENIRFGIQMGQGGLEGSEDYYEWSFRPRSAKNCPNSKLDNDNLYSSCHKKVWDYNAMRLDLANWPQLKLDPQWNGSGIDTVRIESQRVPFFNSSIEDLFYHYYIPTTISDGATLKIYTKPTLSRMKKQNDDYKKKSHRLFLDDTEY
mgnify:CR=1 FL=1